MQYQGQAASAGSYFAKSIEGIPRNVFMCLPFCFMLLALGFKLDTTKNRIFAAIP